MADSPDPIRQTQQWLSNIVVGLNLCPFAAPVINAGGLCIELCEEQEPEAILAAVLRHLDQLQSSSETDIGTSLLVFNRALQNFDQYLDMVAVANDLLPQIALDGEIQIASFHPDYCFEGVDPDDVSHYTNRSPYPMLHFIREAQLSRAIAHYPNPEMIPDNNIDRLRKLGKQALLERLRST